MVNIFQEGILRTHLSQGLLSTSCEFNRVNSNYSNQLTDKQLEVKVTNEEPRKISPIKLQLTSYKKIERGLSLSDSEAESKMLLNPIPLTTLGIPFVTHDLDKSAVSNINTVKSIHSFKTGKDSDISIENWPGGKLTKSPESRADDIIKNSVTDLVNKRDLVVNGSKKKKKFLSVQSRYKQPHEKKDDASSRTIDISAIFPQTITQTVTNTKKNACITSTPFLTSTHNQQVHQYNGSILDQSKFKFDDFATLSQELVKKPGIINQKKGSGSLKESVKGIPLKDYKSNIESEQLFMDLYNARLLQITYLHLKTQRTFEKQEEKVKKQIFSLWAANRKLEKKVEALSLFLETQKLLISVEQLLNSQILGLKPLTSKLSKLNNMASFFTEALERNSHILPISGISCLKDDDLIRALNESCLFLEELFHMTKDREPQIKELVKSSVMLKNTVDLEINEQQKCAALLSGCKPLLNHERSLQVQLIHS